MAEGTHDSEFAEVSEAPAHEFLKTEALKGRKSTQVILQLKVSMEKAGWQGPPIDVVLIDSGKYILNGHHRTYAALVTGTPVRYRIVQLPALSYASSDEVVAAHAEAGPNRIRLD